MFQFKYITLSLALTKLQLATEYFTRPNRQHEAWRHADDALRDLADALEPFPITDTLKLKLGRTKTWAEKRQAGVMPPLLVELDADIRNELINYEPLMVPPARRKDYVDPLDRFGVAADKFDIACDAMAAASRCYAVDEWDASVFHSMRVLEHGLRWLAGQFPNLTLKKPVELENWENIIGNIQARINEDLKGSAPRTQQRDEDLAFYGRAAAEFRYFKDAWRNHVMHNRNDPYGPGETGDVLSHVASFMKILAVRV
jgi:hypothetical protein